MNADICINSEWSTHCNTYPAEARLRLVLSHEFLLTRFPRSLADLWSRGECPLAAMALLWRRVLGEIPSASSKSTSSL